MHLTKRVPRGAIVGVTVEPAGGSQQPTSDAVRHLRLRSEPRGFLARSKAGRGTTDGMNRFALPAVVLAAAALVAVAAGFTTHHSTPVADRAASRRALALQKTFVDVYRNVSPSVVQIRTSNGLGSGIVFDSEGDIVTNDHVVSGSTSLHGHDRRPASS